MAAGHKESANLRGERENAKPAHTRSSLRFCRRQGESVAAVCIFVRLYADVHAHAARGPQGVMQAEVARNNEFVAFCGVNSFTLSGARRAVTDQIRLVRKAHIAFVDMNVQYDTVRSSGTS